MESHSHYEQYNASKNFFHVTAEGPTWWQPTIAMDEFRKNMYVAEPFFVNHHIYKILILPRIFKVYRNRIIYEWFNIRHDNQQNEQSILHQCSRIKQLNISPYLKKFDIKDFTSNLSN